MVFLRYFIVLGDPRTNQNPAFLALGILFYRWHNVLASRIKSRYPLWRDEDIFQAARRWNIATLQVSVVDHSMLCRINCELYKYNRFTSSYINSIQLLSFRTSLPMNTSQHFLAPTYHSIKDTKL